METKKLEEVLTKVGYLDSAKGVCGDTASPTVRFAPNTSPTAESRRINSMLEMEPKGTLASLTQMLLELWCKGDSDAARKIFGEIYERQGKVPLLATLTARYNQLRIWLKDRPEYVGKTHADSCGIEYLFDISTELPSPMDRNRRDRSLLPKEYLEMVAESVPAPRGLSNGGVIFTNGDEVTLPIVDYI